MEEKEYPIYKFSARWNQDDYENNGTSSSHMYKEKLTNIQEAEELEKWWNGVLESPRINKEDKPIKDLHPKLLELSIKFYEENTWCLRWFSHITFNQFENENEAFRSFARFVENKRPLTYEPNPTYCLMGAEDSWRWKICNCDKCKEEGIVAILH